MSLALRALELFGRILYHIGLHRAVIWLHRHQPKVLLYHACEPEPSDFIADLRSNTRPSELEAHLAFLERHYHVVSMAELASGTAGERAVAITFDDGYRTVLEHAVPLLRARRMPASVYLVAQAVDTHELVWVNELNWTLRRHPESVPLVAARLGLPAGAALEVLIARAVEVYDPLETPALIEELRGFAGTGALNAARRAALYLGAEDVRAMANAGGGISFGNHTERHPNLSRLGATRQRHEMDAGRQAVEALVGPCDTIAYPFGLHDDASRRCALETGHDVILEVGGINVPLDRTRIARIPVTATSDAALFSEMEVVTPIKARVRRLLRRAR